MTFASAPARWLGSLAFCFLSCAGAQTLPSDPVTRGSWEAASQLRVPQRFEQAWDVVELMGQPMLSDAQRPARVLLRPQGGLWVDGGCNYFSGRIEHDAQGLFRVYKYGGIHSGCEKPPRSEAILNSALVMVDSYRWDRGLVLSSGGNDLVRLLPSANQDSHDIEQGLASRTASAPAAVPVKETARQDCHQAKVAKSGKAKARHSKAASATRLVCKPAQAKASHQDAKPVGRSKLTAKAKPAARIPASGKRKPAARTKPATASGKHRH